MALTGWMSQNGPPWRRAALLLDLCYTACHTFEPNPVKRARLCPAQRRLAGGLPGRNPAKPLRGVTLIIQNRKGADLVLFELGAQDAIEVSLYYKGQWTKAQYYLLTDTGYDV